MSSWAEEILEERQRTKNYSHVSVAEMAQLMKRTGWNEHQIRTWLTTNARKGHIDLGTIPQRKSQRNINAQYQVQMEDFSHGGQTLVTQHSRRRANTRYVGKASQKNKRFSSDEISLKEWFKEWQIQRRDFDTCLAIKIVLKDLLDILKSKTESTSEMFDSVRESLSWQKEAIATLRQSKMAPGNDENTRECNIEELKELLTKGSAIGVTRELSNKLETYSNACREWCAKAWVLLKRVNYELDDDAESNEWDSSTSSLKTCLDRYERTVTGAADSGGIEEVLLAEWKHEMVSNAVGTTGRGEPFASSVLLEDVDRFFKSRCKAEELGIETVGNNLRLYHSKKLKYPEWTQTSVCCRMGVPYITPVKDMYFLASRLIAEHDELIKSIVDEPISEDSDDEDAMFNNTFGKKKIQNISFEPPNKRLRSQWQHITSFPRHGPLEHAFAPLATSSEIIMQKINNGDLAVAAVRKNHFLESSKLTAIGANEDIMPMARNVIKSSLKKIPQSQLESMSNITSSKLVLNNRSLNDLDTANYLLFFRSRLEEFNAEMQVVLRTASLLAERIPDITQLAQLITYSLSTGGSMVVDLAKRIVPSDKLPEKFTELYDRERKWHIMLRATVLLILSSRLKIQGSKPFPETCKFAIEWFGENLIEDKRLWLAVSAPSMCINNMMAKLPTDCKHCLLMVRSTVSDVEDLKENEIDSLSVIMKFLKWFNAPCPLPSRPKIKKKKDIVRFDNDVKETSKEKENIKEEETDKTEKEEPMVITEEVSNKELQHIESGEEQSNVEIKMEESNDTQKKQNENEEKIVLEDNMNVNLSLDKDSTQSVKDNDVKDSTKDNVKHETETPEASESPAIFNPSVDIDDIFPPTLVTSVQPRAVPSGMAVF
eukprot:TRINITY_DN102412_c0_g1_i1.p1 TRINITY_DN102412_c0_g1~~TRINITY_DN102412_c0_g1_i1.p1  ORF type:complete len:884 (-),score=231.79 TRINITY_DN102412_c0_g1_i1:97-2748(-)